MLFFFLSLLLVFSSLASPSRVVSIINQERHLFSDSPIMFNNSLITDIHNFNKSIDWFYTKSENYSYHYKLLNGSRRWNGDFILEYPEFSEYKKDGWQWMFRDRTFRTVSYIIGMRIRQKSCFDWKMCNRNLFFDYITCLKSFPKIPNLPYVKCDWCYQYYPKMVEPSLKQIACIKLLNKGNNSIFIQTGDNKPMAFFCYGKFSKNITDDYPFN
jgi:hypothetical protein